MLRAPRPSSATCGAAAPGQATGRISHVPAAPGALGAGWSSLELKVFSRGLEEETYTKPLVEKW